MRRPHGSVLVLTAAGALVAGALAAASTTASSAAPAGPRGGNHLEVYVGTMPASSVDQVVALGVDRNELDVSRVSGAAGKGEKPEVRVEAILSPAQVRRLDRGGIEMSPKLVDGETVTQRATAAEEAGLNVFRPYSGPGGLAEEYVQTSIAYPGITKLESIGTTVQGKEILALKVTKNARTTKDGKRPSVLYVSAQHAREWITPEMNRRLMHYVVNGYATDP